VRFNRKPVHVIVYNLTNTVASKAYRLYERKNVLPPYFISAEGHTSCFKGRITIKQQ
jgi:hypothetical protein